MRASEHGRLMRWAKQKNASKKQTKKRVPQRAEKHSHGVRRVAMEGDDAAVGKKKSDKKGSTSVAKGGRPRPKWWKKSRSQSHSPSLQHATANTRQSRGEREHSNGRSREAVAAADKQSKEPSRPLTADLLGVLALRSRKLTGTNENQTRKKAR